MGVLMGVHAAIGGLASQPHWFLTDEDARAYAQATANMIRHFPIQVTQKTIDITAFASLALQIEIPRILMSMQIWRERRAKAARPATPVAQVFQFTPPDGAA